MAKVCLMLLALAACTPVAAGCGDQSASMAELDSSSRSVAAQLLLGADDLPNGAVPEAAPPAEPCGPLPIFARGGAMTATTPLYGFGEVRVKEAVGLFPATGPAIAAYGALNTKQRHECIGEAIAGFDGGQGVPLASQSRSLNLAAEDSLVDFRRSNPSSSGSVEVLSIRSGRCVAALIFQGGDGETARRVGEAAAGLLTGPCEES